MFETARPGVLHRVVWLAMYRAMVNASGERPWRVSFRAGGPGNSALNRPLEDVMRAGQVLSQECSGCVLGYGSQVKDGATAQFGDSVVVTEKGARRLGKRELKVMTL